MKKIGLSVALLVILGGLFVAFPSGKVSAQSQIQLSGSCVSGWSNFNVADGNLIDSNTDVAAVLQIQYDSQGQWCGLERVMYVLRIGAGDPEQYFQGSFVDFGNGQDQAPTSFSRSNFGWLEGAPQTDTYFTYYSPTWTWQYCVSQGDYTQASPSGYASEADGLISCI